MPPASDIGAYADLLETWQRALESPKGIRIRTDTPEAAHALRMRLYHARRAQQRQHKRVYPTDHPMHGRSYYDSMSSRIDKDDPCAVIIFQADAITMEIEEL